MRFFGITPSSADWTCLLTQIRWLWEARLAPNILSLAAKILSGYRFCSLFFSYVPRPWGVPESSKGNGSFPGQFHRQIYPRMWYLYLEEQAPTGPVLQP